MGVNEMSEKIKEELKTFCENVKYLRQSNNLSKKEMAAIMQISVNSIRRIEAGDVPNIGTKAILRAAARFHLLPADLFRIDWRE